MIKLPESCPRKRDDCVALSQVLCDNRPSFVCCGLNDGSDNEVGQDRFVVCWVNDDGSIDERTHWDNRDLMTHVSVVTTALMIHENIKANERTASKGEKWWTELFGGRTRRG